jgi:hypothetical protein
VKILENGIRKVAAGRSHLTKHEMRPAGNEVTEQEASGTPFQMYAYLSGAVIRRVPL